MNDKSLGDAATFAGQTQRRPSSEMSLGGERTLGADSSAGIDTAIGDIEIVDLESRYKIEGTLGQGGMGAVVLATDTRLDRKVAIKRILGEAAGNRMAVQRFLTEAKSIAALNHPNVVQIYDYGRAKDGPFLIMEYVDGGSLLDRCKAGALPLDEAIGLACQLCDGLGKAHDLGIIHRDIKPANVLLTKDGTPKLTDFGLAKAEAGDHGQTMTGAVLGTPDFMPPEQRRDAALVDHRSDLWSLAATIYQMVTGRSPKIIRFNDIPAALQEVLGKALEDRQDARYQSARQLREALKAATGGTGVAKKASVPAPVVADDLQEGQCKSCGTITSDLTKKFCRNPKCGASLRVACLKCESQMPVWDGVCGECGGNQPALVAERCESLSAQKAKAEELAAAFAFDEAAASVVDMAAESRQEFAAFVAWAKEFVESTTKERDRLRAAAKQSLEDAQRHAAACDYPAAIHAIETIPERLRDATAGSLLEQCRSHHEEAERLIVQIADRVKRKELPGLLPLVERAVELRADRKDLSKILGQLRERRDGAVARAREGLASGDAKRALAAFGGMSAEEFAAEDRRLFEQVQQACAIESRLVESVAAAKSDGVVTPEEAAFLFDLCQEYLQLNPESKSIRSLEAQCRRKAARVLQEREQQQILRIPPLENSLGMELKLLPAGTFTMGEAGGNADEAPHEVTLSQPFYLGVYKVTNAQWRSVMGSVPSNWQDDDRPVEQVSWHEAIEFCRKLSALPAEVQAGRVYRLPTESEWEYACRAGTTTRYSFGDAEGKLGEHGWFDTNSGGETHPVGKKRPNPWGLYDMHGNLFEWCSDWFGRYPTVAVTDPQGPSGGSERVSRGGCWISPAGYCRSAQRCWDDPSYQLYFVGFRIALSPSGAQASPPEAEADR
jgi:formylglycine-generating enzyme required for sulfatase activity